MRYAIATTFLAPMIFLSGSAMASPRVDPLVDIYYSWAVETLLPSEPELGHFSIRIIPWREKPETLLDTDGKIVRIRQARRSLWMELRNVLRRTPSASEEELIKELPIVESRISTAQCPPLSATVKSLRKSYNEPLPSQWKVYTDGPRYTLARTSDPFGGIDIIEHPHQQHPVVQAWLRLIDVLNECGAKIVIGK